MKSDRVLKYVFLGVAALICLLLTPFILSFASGKTASFLWGLPSLMIFLAGAAFLFFGTEERKEPLSLLAFAGVLAVLMLTLLARISLLPNVTTDFAEYINIWLQYIREMPGTQSLTEDFANYNMPYLYLLFGIGKLLPYRAYMYAVKVFSVLFDYVLAFFVMKLVGLKLPGKTARICSFFAALLVPSVIVNSAMWGQCDSVFAALALVGLYFGLKDRSKACWAFFALALSFKLQTVFLLPAVLLLLFAKKIRIRDIWVFFAVFIGTLIPAMLAGRGIVSCLSIYWNQANSYSELSMLAPNVFSWLPTGTKSNIPVTAAGIFVAGTVVLGFLLYLYLQRKTLDNDRIFRASLIFALMIPFLLPLMHDRYFYLADTLAVVYLFYRPKRWYIPGMICISSFLCHAAYLFNTTVIPTYVLSFFILGALCLLLKELISGTEKENPRLVSSGESLNGR